MEVRYKRSMGENYMILQEQETERGDSYQMHIFLDNQVPGLLPCKVERVNGESLFYYEISGCQNIQHLFEKEKFTGKDLRELYSAVIRTMEKLDEYLMERGRLLLAPSYIYRNLDSETYLFAWFPFSQNTLESEFQKLTEYILPKINHQDKEAVTIGYGVYRESVESCLHIEAVKTCIFGAKKAEHENYREDKKDICENTPNIETEMKRQKILDDFYEEDDEEETINYWAVGGVICVALCVAGICFFRKNKYIVLVCVILLFLLFIGAGILFVFKKRGTVKTKQKECFAEKYEEAEDEITEKRFSQKLSEKENMTVVLQTGTERGACLKSLDGERTQIYFLQKDVTWIGKRKESVDICLDVPTVSRIHAKIVHRSDGDYLVDLNSRNGTYLDENSLNPEEEYRLWTGNIIRFAAVSFYYVSSGAQPDSKS